MIRDITYRGPLITDTSVPGERKCDGVIPAHANGALRVSARRWMVFFATLDPNGWDAVRSIVYQVRDGAPDGPIMRESLLLGCESGWDPMGDGVPLRRIYGMGMAFGVPKGAVDAAGQPLPNANHFVFKCYRHGLPEENGAILSRERIAEVWPDGSDVKASILRIVWLQFRLNAADDIEIIEPPAEMCQSGYEGTDRFCGVPGARFMNHAMTPPVAADARGTRWCGVDTFASSDGDAWRTHGQVAAVEYEWDDSRERYAWSRSGDLKGIPEIVLGESSISRWDDAWVIALRTWNRGGATIWYRTTDLFGDWGAPAWHSTTWGPRHSYRCADGALRIFHNDQGLSPYGDKRNPLYVFDVDPVTFAYGEPRVVFDARGVLPFDLPFCDMSKLCPPQGNRQLLVFRAIDHTQTTDARAPTPETAAERLAAAGIHAVELTYDRVEPEQWTFADSTHSHLPLASTV